VLPGQEHRVARLAAVGGHRHGGAVAVGGDQPCDRFGADQRLVGQGHDDRADIGTGLVSWAGSGVGLVSWAGVGGGTGSGVGLVSWAGVGGGR